MSAAEAFMNLDAPDLVPGATLKLAEFASSLSYDKIPQELIPKVKELILDNLGVVIFGNQTLWAKLVSEMAIEAEAKPVSAILGRHAKTSPALAALANSTGGHGFEFDEIHSDSGYHPGSIIIPVILALAQSEGNRSGRDFITATIAAYEVGIRVGMSMGSGLFFRGHHPQGSTGTFPAAVAASRILNLDAEKTQQAMGISGSFAAGLMAAQEGSMVKRMHAGNAAQHGVQAAILARKGFTGIDNVLEASFGGFLQSFSSKPMPEMLLAGLGTEWETKKVGYKHYSTVASIHTALDGLLTIMQENKLKADDIEEVDVGCGKVTYRHCAWEYKPIGVTGAQMNLFFPLAVIALEGAAGPDQFKEERLKEPKILELVKRMKAHVDTELEAKGRAFRHAARVAVRTKDGRTFDKVEMYRRGSPGNLAREGDIEKKFRLLAGAALDKDRVERLWQFVQNLENQKSLDELYEILA